MKYTNFSCQTGNSVKIQFNRIAVKKSADILTEYNLHGERSEASGAFLSSHCGTCPQVTNHTVFTQGANFSTSEPVPQIIPVPISVLSCIRPLCRTVTLKFFLQAGSDPSTQGMTKINYFHFFILRTVFSIVAPPGNIKMSFYKSLINLFPSRLSRPFSCSYHSFCPFFGRCSKRKWFQLSGNHINFFGNCI